MKILHTSDWHVGRRTGGRDRSEEHVLVLEEIVELAASNSVDMTLVSGDLFDSAAPRPGAEKIVWNALLELAEVGAVLVIAGNHDNPARFDAIAPVLDKAGVKVVGTPLAPSGGGVSFFDDLGVAVGMLPFVSQRGIVRAEDVMAADPDENANKYADRMRRIVHALTDSMPSDAIKMLMGHLTVFDAKHGGGERLAHTVFDYAVPASVFPGHLSYVGLGHLHRQQPVPHPAAVWYSGSPMQLDFGEVDDRKGVLLVDASPAMPATVTEMPITSGRRLVTLRGSFEEVMSRSDGLGDALVKVVLDEKARVGLADEVREVIPNAVIVAVDDAPSAPSPREPRQEMAPRDAFAAYLTEREDEDEAVLRLFTELLEEVPT